MENYKAAGFDGLVTQDSKLVKIIRDYGAGQHRQIKGFIVSPNLKPEAQAELIALMHTNNKDTLFIVPYGSKDLVAHPGIELANFPSEVTDQHKVTVLYSGDLSPSDMTIPPYSDLAVFHNKHQELQTAIFATCCDYKAQRVAGIFVERAPEMADHHPSTQGDVVHRCSDDRAPGTAV